MGKMSTCGRLIFRSMMLN